MCSLAFMRICPVKHYSVQDALTIGANLDLGTMAYGTIITGKITRNPYWSVLNELHLKGTSQSETQCCGSGIFILDPF
jgi:hypothetical protein